VNEDRSQFLGGTDVASICGYGYSSQYVIGLEKTGLLEREVAEYEEEASVGREAEDFILSWYERTRGVKVGDRQSPFFHPEHRFCRALLDGRVETLHEKDPDTIVDAKCLHWSKKADFDRGLIDRGMRIQMQWYMWVTGAEMAHLACWFGSADREIYEIPRNDKLIRIITTRALDWWDRHIVRREPLAPDPSRQGDIRALKALYAPNGSEVVVTPTPRLGRVLEAKFYAAQLGTYAKKLKEAADAELRYLIGDNSKLLLDGTGIEVELKQRHRKAYSVEAADYTEVTVKLPKGVSKPSIEGLTVPKSGIRAITGGDNE
jgi:predicted phage-related endonuclease